MVSNEEKISVLPNEIGFFGISLANNDSDAIAIILSLVFSQSFVEYYLDFKEDSKTPKLF